MFLLVKRGLVCFQKKHKTQQTIAKLKGILEKKTKEELIFKLILFFFYVH